VNRIRWHTAGREQILYRLFEGLGIEWASLRYAIPLQSRTAGVMTGIVFAAISHYLNTGLRKSSVFAQEL
jgi:hypothetical protein